MEEVKIEGLVDGQLKIELSGDIDLGNAEAFYQTIVDAYNLSPANITFDCERLDFIDSTTLGTFVKILKVLNIKGHDQESKVTTYRIW